ncbi:hypothetical protein PCL_11248 [Purpureocillium lilacinum]|uniref:Uncharacterized protein n=1 Tax=Purpureocillium lilacinum TaxID=33203 RepID=A0A2U3DPZ9_PURLI|nr:hypothetical protein PCL_11248 [Purpureocillium lilacinum]
MDCTICSRTFHSTGDLTSHTEYWQQQIQYHLAALAQCFRHQGFDSTVEVTTTVGDQLNKTGSEAPPTSSKKESFPAKAIDRHSPSADDSSVCIRHSPYTRPRGSRTAVKGHYNRKGPNFAENNVPTHVGSTSVGSRPNYLSISDNQVFLCAHLGCDKQLKTIWDWRRHYGTHVKINETCPACKRPLTRASHVLNHRCTSSNTDPLSSQRQDISNWLDLLGGQRNDATTAASDFVAAQNDGPLCSQSVPTMPTNNWASQETATQVPAQIVHDSLNGVSIGLPEGQCHTGPTELSPAAILRDGSAAPTIWGYQAHLFTDSCNNNSWIGSGDLAIDHMTNDMGPP